MSEWQPISTAPKDRIIILVFSSWLLEDGGDNWCMRLVYWDDEYWREVGMNNKLNPTHWMRLPEPPK